MSPLNDPVRVAGQAATLDQLSQGRFDFGVGRGFIRDEFDIFGVDMKDSRERVEEGVELIKQAWAGPTMEFNSKFRPPLFGLPLLPPIYQKPHPPIWVACLMSPESFEWTAERATICSMSPTTSIIRWRSSASAGIAALCRNSAAASPITRFCCVYHAHFLDSDDDAKLQEIVHKPMSEYAAAGLEAARKPPDPIAYKGYERREAGQRDFGFNAYFPGRVVMGGPEPGDRAHPRAARHRHHPDRIIGGLRLAAAGRDHALAAYLRRSRLAARPRHLALRI